MDYIAIEKDQIEEKLRRDEGVVKQLESSLEQSSHNTNSLVRILDSVQSRLRRLETTIVPVYRQTLEQTRMQKNVESALQALNRVIGYHFLCEQVESRINEGPSANDLDEFVEMLERLKEAKEYFSVYSPHSFELQEVSTLFDSGCDLLIREFRIILQKNSRPVPESILIDLATSEDQTPLESFSLNVMSQLQAITSYLASKALNTDFMNIYFQVRSENLLRSLASMKDSDRAQKLQKDSKDLRRNLFQGPRRKSERLVNAIPRSSVARTLNESIDSLSGSKDESLVGSTSFLLIASAFLHLIGSEYSLMKNIIPLEHQELILDKLVEKSLSNFLTEFETLNSRARNSLTQKKDFVVVMPLLGVIKHMNILMPGYQTILDKSLSKAHLRIQAMNVKCGELAIKFLDEFIGEISSQPCKITAVPKDGTVHEVTSQTMSFMEQLLEHLNTAGHLWAAKDPSFSRIEDPALQSTKGMASCQHRILSTLTMKLEGKATCYESACLRNIFLLNNYHFIRKTLTRSPSMIQLLEQEMADLEDKFNELIGKQRKGYTAYSFGKLATHIQDPVAVPEGTDKLNAALKQSIKDRFRGFNNEIDELVRVQKSYSIPDQHLRESLRSENVNLVIPLYSEFFSAYSKAPFTKNPEKYIKYTPDNVNDMLMSLFDAAS